MNRSELQDNMIQQILEDMDIKTMMAILYDNMSESYDKYSDEELITDDICFKLHQSNYEQS